MDSAKRVRYLRCQGPFLAKLAPDAAWVVVRIEFDGEQDWFAGYVLVEANGHVLEKSDTYGLFAEEADWLEGDADAHCVPASQGEFAEAWRHPYAQRSLWRRFLARLNGASDWDGDPSQRDDPNSTG